MHQILTLNNFRYGAKLVHEKNLSTGVFASFFLYMLQVAIALSFLAGIYTGKCEIFVEK